MNMGVTGVHFNLLGGTWIQKGWEPMIQIFPIVIEVVIGLGLPSFVGKQIKFTEFSNFNFS